MTKRKKYGIRNSLIAKWFGYSSERSFNSSKAKDDMTNGIEKLIQHIENQMINNLKE
jgi:hypothetical protein